MKYEDIKIKIELSPLEVIYITRALAIVDFKGIDVQDCFNEIEENICDDFVNILDEFNIPLGFAKHNEGDAPHDKQ